MKILFNILLILCCNQLHANFNFKLKEFDSKLIKEWNNATYNCIKKTILISPPVASRIYAYIGLAAYQSGYRGIKNAKSLNGKIQNMPKMPLPNMQQSYFWPMAINSAIAQMLRLQFEKMPKENAQFINLLERSFELKYLQDIDKETIERSKFYGILIADHIFSFSKSDGGFQAFDVNNAFPYSYIVDSSYGKWKRTPKYYEPPLLPYWGNNRTFFKNTLAFSKPNLPHEFSLDVHSEFQKSLKQFIEIRNNLNDSQKLIAKYWDDISGESGTPPGHLMAIVVQLMSNQNLNLEQGLKLFVKSAIALNEACISCWNTKYKYCTIRPITVMREHVLDKTYLSYLITPNFPEYTSGHSTMTGAISHILEQQFGTSFAFIDSTHFLRIDKTLPARPFTSFHQMALECSISRVYGGIHFMYACDEGLNQGKKVAILTRKKLKM